MGVSHLNKMLVKHRNQVVITPVKDRRCPACKQDFKSKGGLRSHQSRSTNSLCQRAGKIRMGSEWAKKAKNRFWEKKKVFNLKNSLFEKHSRGKTSFGKSLTSGQNTEIRNTAFILSKNAHFFFCI